MDIPRGSSEFQSFSSEELAWPKENVPKASEYVAILGCGVEKNPLERIETAGRPDIHLNEDASFTVAAAGLLWLRNRVEGRRTILSLLGGPTGGPLLPSEGQAMRTMLLDLFPFIPESDIHFEGNEPAGSSFDTGENAKNAVRDLNVMATDGQLNDHVEVTVLTRGFHGPRAHDRFFKELRSDRRLEQSNVTPYLRVVSDIDTLNSMLGMQLQTPDGQAVAKDIEIAQARQNTYEKRELLLRIMSKFPGGSAFLSGLARYQRHGLRPFEPANLERPEGERLQASEIIAILGYGVSKKPAERVTVPGPDIHLSQDSFLTVVAAALKWIENRQEGKRTILLLLGGATKGPKYQSGGEAMEVFMNTLFPFIPREDYVVEGRGRWSASFDTRENAIYAMKYVGGLAKVGEIARNCVLSVLTAGVHHKRARLIFDKQFQHDLSGLQRYGVRPELRYLVDTDIVDRLLGAEISEDPELQQDIAAVKRRQKGYERGESVMRFITRLPLGSWLLTQVARVYRHGIIG